MNTCRWSEDGDGGPWATMCGNYFEITEGTPDENGFKFCCYCGRKLVQVPYEEETDNDLGIVKRRTQLAPTCLRCNMLIDPFTCRIVEQGVICLKCCELEKDLEE